MAEPGPPLDFSVGEIYRRRDIHKSFNGQRQGGISTPKGIPFIFLFTGDSGHQYGYHDGFREDGTYWYTGEGQKGPMKMQRGNRAILEHEQNSRELLLFEEVDRGLVRFVGRARYLGHHKQVAPDGKGEPRQAIVFELEIEEAAEGSPIGPEPVAKKSKLSNLMSRSLEELRRLALQKAGAAASKQERRRNVRLRSLYVKAYVLKRAGGICEGCGSPAPFLRESGEPYLEPHHILRLADEGPDDPKWTAALCPNCHRRVHHGADGQDFNNQLATLTASIEQSSRARQ